MGFMNQISEKWSAAVHKEEAEGEQNLTVIQKIEKVIGIIFKVLYHLRKIVLTVPVAYYALKLASYNTAHLPETVGLFLQDNGAFAMQISRSMAVMGPLGLTAGCLVMMFLARKALYPWAVSLFTLVLPVLLLVSNLYPA